MRRSNAISMPTKPGAAAFGATFDAKRNDASVMAAGIAVVDKLLIGEAFLKDLL